MRLSVLIKHLEAFAPLNYQEDYDNSGLIVGDPNEEIRGALVALDCIESIVDEAILHNCNLIITHHPIVFKGLKKITGKNYVERVVLKAIKNNIALYAIHTNLDHVAYGVNGVISNRLGLKNTKVLSPKSSILKKLVTFCPIDQSEVLRDALLLRGLEIFLIIVNVALMQMVLALLKVVKVQTLLLEKLAFSIRKPR